MQFSRANLQADLALLRSSRSPVDHAVGDNCAFEERVCDVRRDAFEAAAISPLMDLLAYHFKLDVQGALRSHIPVTFTTINDGAIYRPDVEPNQKIVRIECIDTPLNDIRRSFADIEQAVRPGHRDIDLVAQLVDQLRLYPGARPAFVAFKAEVVADLGASD